MEQVPEPAKRRKTPWLMGGAVLGLFLLLVALQSSNLWRNLAIETSGDVILLYALSSLNFLAFVILAFVLARSIIRLVVERRTLQPGSKIKTRLLFYFFAISILPILAMAIFSYLFMNRALERWFTQVPENVVRQTAELQGRAVSERSAMLRETAKILAATLEKEDLSDLRLAAIARLGGMTYLAVEGIDGRRVGGFADGVSDADKSEVTQLLDGASGSADGFGFDMAIADMPGGGRLLVVPGRFAEGAAGQIADASMGEFESLKQKEVTIRQVGLLTLGVLTFMLIFASTWIAFYTARGLTNPIRALVEAADEIGKGNLAHRVRVMAADELAVLVAAFNEMSATLEENSEEITARRRYIETVLDTLPTGVISLDGDNRVETINRAARSIMRLEDGDFAGVSVETLMRAEDALTVQRVVNRARRVGHASENSQLRRDDPDGSPNDAAEISVALTAAALPTAGGTVLVIEDLSELIAAQRASAWQEVARRMAHEIKNPLTPIQLSAERIAKRFERSGHVENGGGNRIDDKGPLGELVHESTATIIREVQSLKMLVDEFSRFAKLPDAKFERDNVNRIVETAVAVFEGRFSDVTINVAAGTSIPDTRLDGEQLKRVLINLIENSVESFTPETDSKCIAISTRFDRARELIVIEVADNGKGVAPADLPNLFQPYFSTKGRGTGLGLAIVRRIISDHGGRINAAANLPKGAKFVIELPAAQTL